MAVDVGSTNEKLKEQLRIQREQIKHADTNSELPIVQIQKLKRIVERKEALIRNLKIQAKFKKNINSIENYKLLVENVQNAKMVEALSEKLKTHSELFERLSNFLVDNPLAKANPELLALLERELQSTKLQLDYHEFPDHKLAKIPPVKELIK